MFGRTDNKIKMYFEQTVNYRIPVNLADDLTWFDGSVYIDRTGA
jgi:hypothetical protein